MIKIVHITAVDISLRYFLLDQLKFLRRHRFDVYAISSTGEHIPAIQNAGITHFPVKITRQYFSPFRDTLSLIRLVYLMRKHKFQIVHTHTPKASFIGQIAARIAGIPIIIRTVHGFHFDENTRPLARSIFIMLERIEGRISDLILSQNTEDIKTAIETGICRPEKIIFLGNGINLKKFDPGQISSERQKNLRRDLNIQEDDFVIGFVGRLVEVKGLLEVFQAVRIVRESIPNIKLLIVGAVDVEKKDAVRPEMAKKYGISDICIFAGLQEDMPTFFSIMNVFVLPSHGREGLPRVAMEASAMGIPNILTDIRGSREIVTDGENGILVPVKNIDLLTKAIIELLTDPQKANQMGMMGRQKALREFDEKKVFNTVLSNYRTLIDQKNIQ